MKTTHTLRLLAATGLLAASGLLASCAATAPSELRNAREAYRRASTGPASVAAPAELHVADLALAKAEKAFRNEDEDFEIKDLAYVAQRKAQLAEATASIAAEKKTQAAAAEDFQATQGRIVDQTRKDLKDSKTALAASEQTGQATAEKLEAEKAARLAAEQRTAAALAALAKLAAVKEDQRGTVITLSGSVLFASNRTALLPAARSRLDQVAEVLMSTQERTITVEGHTDSQGTEAHNTELSQGRADAVRTYLMERGYQGDRIMARGLGEGTPVGDNKNAEGRANNRRVEIIIPHGAQASNQ